MALSMETAKKIGLRTSTIENYWEDKPKVCFFSQLFYYEILIVISGSRERENEEWLDEQGG